MKLFLIANILLIPIIMILMGYYFKKHPTKDINPILGYRTNRSMKNQDTWNYAQAYAGKLYYQLGIFSTVIFMIISLLLIGIDYNYLETVSMLVIFLQLILLFVPIFFVEKQLKAVFDEHGMKKDPS